MKSKNLLILCLMVTGLQAMENQLREPLVGGASQAQPVTPAPETRVAESCTVAPVIGQPQLGCWKRVKEGMRSCGYRINDSWRGLSQGTRDTVVSTALLATALLSASEDVWGYNDLFPALIQTATGAAMGLGPLAKYAFWGKALAVGIEVPADITANWFLAQAGKAHCPHTGFLAVAMGVFGLTSVKVEIAKNAAVTEARRWTLHELALAMSVAPKVISAIQNLEREDRAPAAVRERITIIRSLYSQDAHAFNWDAPDLDRARLQVEQVMAWTDLGALPRIQEVLKAKITKAQSAQAV